jgi:Protein of unknown function (DUF3429)
MSNVPPFWSRIITLVAVGGLLPFIGGLLITLAPSFWPFDQLVFERAMIGYGVLILAFLGGVRWGLRLQGGAGSDLVFLMGIVGSIAGFFTLLLPYTFGLVILTIGFALQGAWDIWSSGVPQFYSRLRATMTTLVCLVLIAILIARVMTAA